MGFIGIGAVLALLLAFLTLRAKARHDRAVRLIHQTPVTPIADLVQSFTAHADPASPTPAAVQGRVVARETTRLTAPLTGSSCVAYKVRVYKLGDADNDDENYIEDSRWVPWAVNDGTGLALAPFNPLEYPFFWPGTKSSGDTFKDAPRQLDRVISHYGRGRLPSPEGWPSPSYGDLSWEMSILKEFGNEVFLLGPCTVQEGCAHFQLGSGAARIWNLSHKFLVAATDSLLWFGSRADALSHEQLSAKRSARWTKIWFTVSVIFAAAYLHFGWALKVTG